MELKIGDTVLLRNRQLVKLTEFGNSEYYHAAALKDKEPCLAFTYDTGYEQDILRKALPKQICQCSSCGDGLNQGQYTIDHELLCEACYQEHMHNIQDAIDWQETIDELRYWSL